MSQIISDEGNPAKQPAPTVTFQTTLPPKQSQQIQKLINEI